MVQVSQTETVFPFTNIGEGSVMLTTFKGATDAALAAVEEEMGVRKTTELFLMFPMGSQFDHLIVQHLERLGVFCLVADPSSVTAGDVRKLKPIGIILSGGPASAHIDPPAFDTEIFDLGIPLLGICLGFQLWAQHVGCTVETADRREFGRHRLAIRSGRHDFVCGIPSALNVLQSHGDVVISHETLEVLGKTENAPVSVAACGHLLGVQFHPEVTDTDHGDQFFENFCFRVCCAKDRFPAEKMAGRKIEWLRSEVGTRRVLLALSGGCDSSTTAYLLREAFKDGPCRVRAVYIKGLDRPDDEQFVLEHFANQPWLEFVTVDATDRFLEALAGKRTMKEKRIAMRSVYGPILDEQADAWDDGEGVVIVQGTLYTDISESGFGYDSGATKARIKLHHNVKLGLSRPEILPLADCVKDGGRNIGRAIGVPEELITRHPFPGPGLAIRVEDEVTAEVLKLARAVDGIWIEELRKWGFYHNVWQAGAVVTRSVHTTSRGDDAGEGVLVALWAVWSVNGFTAQCAELPWDFIIHVSRRITNEVVGVGVVAYRTTAKPPGTIEWG